MAELPNLNRSSNRSSLLEVLSVPDHRLRLRSTPVERFDDQLDQLTLRMLATTSLKSGVGLSAPQVGVNLRLFVMDLSLWGVKKTYVVVNPEIVGRSDDIESRPEACLSIPETLNQYDEKGVLVRQGEKISVPRHRLIRLRYLEPDGKRRQHWLDVQASWIAQHEIDHLDGKLITDYLPPVAAPLSIAS